MTAPSNSAPRAPVMVYGLKAFQMMLSQMLVAMKREIPEPSPYPFCSSSSRQMTMMPAKNSCSSTELCKPRPDVLRKDKHDRLESLQLVHAAENDSAQGVLWFIHQ